MRGRSPNSKKSVRVLEACERARVRDSERPRFGASLSLCMHVRARSCGVKQTFVWRGGLRW